MAEKITLTSTLIAEFPIPKSGRDTWHDQRTPGLQVRVSPSGVKTFSWFRRTKGSNPERITLGRWPTMSIEEARQHASHLNAMVAEGNSPTEQRQAIDEEMTFAELFADYMERWAKVRKKTWKGDESKYRLHLVPLHEKKVSSITRRDIAAIHASVGKDHPAFANRILALLSKVFNVGIESGMVDMANPARGIRYYREISRDRFLSGEELQRFVAALHEEKPVLRVFFLTCLLTGARKWNILSMRWTDIDFAR
ncbi:MAG: integrase family protein, partial [Magnetococcus sp. YQC-5]